MLVTILEWLRSISTDITYSAISDEDKENHSDYYNMRANTPSSAGGSIAKSTYFK